MKIIKGFVGFFKVFGLLLLRRKRILNIKKQSDATIVLRRLLDKGLLKHSALSKKLARQSEKDMDRQVRKAVRKGRTITVNDLVITIKEDASFLELCEELGLPLVFFEGLAENALEKYKVTQKRSLLRSLLSFVHIGNI